MPSSQDTSFARLVSLACHDLRTPLATVHGFARTILRSAQLPEPQNRYVEMIDAASEQLADLLEDLSLVARIESGRYEPTLNAADSLALARVAAERVGVESVGVEGGGGPVTVDLAAAERAVTSLVRCALRHGGLEHVDVRAEGTELVVTPITAAAGPIVLGEDLRDLGAAVAAQLVRALGGSLEVEGERLRIRLPPATAGAARAAGP